MNSAAIQLRAPITALSSLCEVLKLRVPTAGYTSAAVELHGHCQVDRRRGGAPRAAAPHEGADRGKPIEHPVAYHNSRADDLALCYDNTKCATASGEGFGHADFGDPDAETDGEVG